MTYKHDDGRLILAEWAGMGGVNAYGQDLTMLAVNHRERPVPMYGTKASGERMVSNGHLGVDLIRVPAGEGFSPHTHPGDHLLIAVAGEGTVTVDGLIYPTRAGQVYMVEGAVPHAVGAITDHVLLAVGSPHRNIDAADRMTLTDYAAIAATMGDLHCLVCDGGPQGTPEALRQLGCPHTPAEAPSTRPLVVGLAPATANHEGWRAFENTDAGDRLAALLDVGPDRMLEVVDTVNLSPHFLPHWEKVPAGRWEHLARERVKPELAGRVVVCCGRRVAEALGVRRFGIGTASAVYPYTDQAHPFLAVTIPHPRTTELGGTWADADTVARTQAALAVSVNLARTGPAAGMWSTDDADAFNEAVARIAAANVDTLT